MNNIANAIKLLERGVVALERIAEALNPQPPQPRWPRWPEHEPH